MPVDPVATETTSTQHDVVSYRPEDDTQVHAMIKRRQRTGRLIIDFNGGNAYFVSFDVRRKLSLPK